MKKSGASQGQPASELISKRIAELGDWRGKTLGRMRKLIKQADPDVVEEWKWMGTPIWSHDGIICTGESYKNVVKLTFAKGASLKDTARLFNSSLANERLEGGLVDFFSFVDVDRAAHVSVQARVEETGRIFQRRALGEGQLHDILVGFASADDAVVRPNRGAGFGWFDPLPLLDDVRVCFLDERAQSAEGFPAPVPEFGDSFRNELRCRLALARVRCFHVLIPEE